MCSFFNLNVTAVYVGRFVFIEYSQYIQYLKQTHLVGQDVLLIDFIRDQS